jgi:hypothetical protein
MLLTDLFEVKFMNHKRYQKPIMFLISKIKHFETDNDQNKALIDEYMNLIKGKENLSVYLDLTSFDTVSLQSVWEGISEITFYDDIIARSIKQECMLLVNENIISITNKLLKIHKPIFRFKIVTNEKDGIKFLSEGMENGFQK